MPNLGLKMPFLSIFDQKCLIWVFLGKNLKKTIVIFEISTLKFHPKILDLCISGLEFENKIVILEISTLKFVKLQNFLKKEKNLNLGPKIRYLGIFGLDFKKLLSYMKSAPSNFSK